MTQGITYDGIPLMITNIGDEPSVITLTPHGYFNAQIYYKLGNGKFYKKWNYNAITLPPNSTLSLFGDSSTFSSSTTNYANFSITGSSVKLSGRLASISNTKGVTYTYYSLFRNCTSVVEVSSDFLEGVLIPTSGYAGSSIFSYLFSNTGITQVPEGFFDFREPVITIYACLSVYEYMFKDCKSLVSVPQSIFEKETYICQKQYQGMFSGCIALTQAPDIYATNAPWLCCSGMFYNCESLENPPQIAVNNYSDSSAFSNMFQGCTSLKQAPTMYDLIKDGGSSSQHTEMFKNCTSLNYVEVSFTQWKIYYSGNDRLYSHTLSWLANVSPTGTFICPKELADATDGYYDEEGNFVEGVGRGADTVPEGWTIDFPIIDARDGDANAMALMAVISQQTHADGTPWVKDSLVMMKSEAEKVEDIGTAFQGNKSITSFDQLQYFGITSIKTKAFESCSVLRSITLPNIQSIESQAFSGCVRLGNVTFPESLLSIASHAFRYCYYFTDIFIPGGLNSVSENAFTSIDVNSIVVSQDNTTYDSRNNCNAIIQTNTNKLVIGCKNTTILDDIESIGNSAFYSYGVPSNIVIHSNIKSIGNMAFMQTRNAISTITFEEGLTSLGASAFMYQNSIQEILLPNSLITIGSNCFVNMKNIKKIRIGNAVKSIFNAFTGCSALETLICEVEVPIDLTYIANNGQIINAIPNNTCILYVPDNSVEAYSQQDYWGRFSQIKPLSDYTE